MSEHFFRLPDRASGFAILIAQDYPGAMGFDNGRNVIPWAPGVDAVFIYNMPIRHAEFDKDGLQTKAGVTHEALHMTIILSLAAKEADFIDAVEVEDQSKLRAYMRNNHVIADHYSLSSTPPIKAPVKPTGVEYMDKRPNPQKVVVA